MSENEEDFREAMRGKPYPGYRAEDGEVFFRLLSTIAPESTIDIFAHVANATRQLSRARKRLAEEQRYAALRKQFSHVA